MIDTRVNKSNPERLLELFELLRCLADDISAVQMESKRYKMRSILGLLRTLVADNSNGANDGLLVDLSNTYKYDGIISTDRGDFTLVEYMNEAMMIVSGDSKMRRTRAEIIREAAQQDGSAHGSPYRTQNHFLLMSILDMGRTPKTDPFRGVFLDIAQRIGKYGEEFLLFATKVDL